MRTSFGFLAVVLAAAVGAGVGASGTAPLAEPAAADSPRAESPLPEPQQFMAEVRERLESDEERQRDYVFVETRVERKLDASGRPTEESRKVFESFPGLPGERRWRQLIEENGEPVPASEIERQAIERREQIAAWRRDGSPEAPDAGGDSGRRGRTEERIDEAFRVFRFDIVGRERRDGHDTVVFSLRPRPDAKPATREGRVMRYFHGRAWVNESDYELVRLEAEAVDDVSIGLGLLGRVHKGSRFSFERQPVADGTWVPVRSSYSASMRVLLVRRIRMAGTTEYSDYRRVSPDLALAP